MFVCLSVFWPAFADGHAGDASYRLTWGIPIGKAATVDVRNAHASYVVTWWVSSSQQQWCIACWRRSGTHCLPLRLWCLRVFCSNSVVHLHGFPDDPNILRMTSSATPIMTWKSDESVIEFWEWTSPQQGCKVNSWIYEHISLYCFIIPGVWMSWTVISMDNVKCGSCIYIGNSTYFGLTCM